MTTRAIPRSLLIFGLALAGIIVCAVVAIFAYAPWIGASTVPQLFGFEAVKQNVYIERGYSEAYAEQVATLVTLARSRVAIYFGKMTVHPVVLVCRTDSCFERLADGLDLAKAVSYMDRVLVLSPRGINTVIMSHELTHIEFHHRIGVLGQAHTPAWFDEGLATLVSNDPRYIGAPGTSDRCLAKFDGVLPSSRREWDAQAERAQANPAIYKFAACRVYRWIQKNGGRGAIAQLVTALRHGESFSTAYQGHT